MGHWSDHEVHRAFEEFKAKETDKCLSVKCLYCQTIRAKNTSRQRAHLLSCTPYLEAMKAEGRETSITQDAASHGPLTLGGVDGGPPGSGGPRPSPYLSSGSYVSRRKYNTARESGAPYTCKHCHETFETENKLQRHQWANPSCRGPAPANTTPSGGAGGSSSSLFPSSRSILPEKRRHAEDTTFMSVHDIVAKIERREREQNEEIKRLRKQLEVLEESHYEQTESLHLLRYMLFEREREMFNFSAGRNGGTPGDGGEAGDAARNKTSVNNNRALGGRGAEDDNEDDADADADMEGGGGPDRPSNGLVGDNTTPAQGQADRRGPGRPPKNLPNPMAGGRQPMWYSGLLPPWADMP